MRDILTRRLEKKLSEKEQEIQELQASLREEIEKELSYYCEQITSLKSQMAEMNEAIEELTRELLDQKKQNEEMKSILGSLMTPAEPHKKHPGKMEVVSREDDAIVMIRRR
jgi:septal ring factor EnvC (AmiA/AmiB activator)